MDCPVCDVDLVISSREGIEIDHCPQCRGVWLDRGELDKIIERAAPSVMRGGGGGDAYAAAPPPQQSPAAPRYEEPRRYDEPRRDDRYDPRSDTRKKKRSFLEDIFDFD
jgi:Zn-finger nucleic acid-binding protein